MKTTEPSTWSILDVAEGFYLASALEALESVGVLDSLNIPTSVSTLASRHGVDAVILEAALRFLASRTSLVARRAGRYRLTPLYDSKSKFMHHQYLGAYGQNAVHLGAILRDPGRAEKLVNRPRHAKAFAQVNVTSANLVADLISQLQFNHVLDLGCGAGTLLVNLALRDSEFVGWGLDANLWMCREAKKRAGSADVAKRVKIFVGDCRAVEASLPLKVRKAVETISAANVANEFFGGGSKQAIEWLAVLKAAFPGRTLLIADYCGGSKTATKARSRELALHDFVQAISGQGVPPTNKAAWEKVYRSARCELVHVLELEDTPFFVHLLRL